MLKAVFTDGVDEITAHGLTQWDAGQEIELTIPKLPQKFQAHFAHKRAGTAYVVECASTNGVATVPIPNILLQQATNAVMWVYVADGSYGETTKTVNLPIVARAKPEDYVYTEIERMNYSQLDARLTKVEQNGFTTAVVKQAVEDYLTENPMEILTETMLDGVIAEVWNGKISIAPEDWEWNDLTERYEHLVYNSALTSSRDIAWQFSDAQSGKYLFQSMLPANGTAMVCTNEVPSETLVLTLSITERRDRDYAGEGSRLGGDTTGSGEDGGYYIPTVTVDGVLSWTPSKTSMPSVESVNIKGADGADGADGSDGEDGNGIKSAVLNADYTLTLTFDDGTTYTTPSIRGATGAAGKDGSNGSNGSDGVGIASIKQTTTSTADGGNNVFTVTLTNGTSATFTVKNGSKGSAGSNGTNGVSATHSWNGTVLTVTSASGTSSADLKGDPYTLTETDKASIVQAVIESLGGNPIFGYVDANNNIIVSGDLPDGTYSVKYEMDDDSTVNIGNLVIDSNTYYTVTANLTHCTTNGASQAVGGGSYTATITANDGYELKTVTVTMGGTDVTASTVTSGTVNIGSVTGDIVITAVAEKATVEIINQIPISTDANGNVLVGANGEKGYKPNTRLSTSSGSETTASGKELTGFIPCTWNDTIYFKNIRVTTASTETYLFYDANRTKIYGGTTGGTFGATNGEVISKTISSINVTQLIEARDSIAFIRITADAITADSIITINQSIS